MHSEFDYPVFERTLTELGLLAAILLDSAVWRRFYGEASGVHFLRERRQSAPDALSRFACWRMQLQRSTTFIFIYC